MCLKEKKKEKKTRARATQDSLALLFDPRRRSFRGFRGERETETDGPKERERERVREGRTDERVPPVPSPPRDGTERYVNGECGL